MTCILIGLFDRDADADRAVASLLRIAGDDLQAVELYTSRPDAEPEGVGKASVALGRLALPAEDDLLFQEGVRRGGVVLAAWMTERHLQQALAVFEACGAVDLDRREAEPADERAGQQGYTGHDEDIGFATFGGDAVLGHIPRNHHDDTPAGLAGRLEMAATRRDPERSRAQVRVFVRETQRP
ncbi:hypothetical protein E0493_06590 [Roseomonas sp. M0104]|uniref:Uncharacterized protein n=1 Tax=Teichococcus coralli TaxID=2545983 RepID=A0A845BA29_9PROT|nr:hypothetical protein [Pseudoroseomonas coralli]MXP63020.1 hypothetical protein [Pseudoroseomonas coralli]